MAQLILVLPSLIVNITKHIVGQLQQQAVMVVSVMVMLYLKRQDGMVTTIDMLTRSPLGSFVVIAMTMARMQECSSSTTPAAMLSAPLRSVSFSSLRALALLL